MDIPYMTVQQAAIFLHRSDQTIRNWCKPEGKPEQQKLKNAQKNKNRWEIPVESVLNLFKR